VDFIVIREQTEGEYSALEHEVRLLIKKYSFFFISNIFKSVRGVVESLKITTYENSRRIAKFAFDFATKFNRKKITAVHKANIMFVDLFFYSILFIFLLNIGNLVMVFFLNHVVKSQHYIQILN
jgi:isocitrate/isopropylmalate dehydrogenase